MKTNKEIFDEQVQLHYNEIKQKLIDKGIWNEDIFHNTILYCYNLFGTDDGRELHPENTCRYFISAYKTNLYRNNNYAEHKNISFEDTVVEDCGDETDYTQVHHDYLVVREILTQKFGPYLPMLLRLYCLGGYSIKELEEKSGQKNLAY